MWSTSPEVSAQGEPRAWLSNGEALSVIAATHDGIYVELNPGQALQAGQHVDVSLGDATRMVGPFPANVTSMEEAAANRRVAVLRFGALTQERRRQLASVLLRWPAMARLRATDVIELSTRAITDPQRIETILSMLEGEHVRGLIRSGERYTGTRIGRLTIDESEALPLRWEVDGPIGPPPFFIDVGVYEYLYVIPVVRAQRSGSFLMIGRPDEILRLPITGLWLRAIADGSTCTLSLDGEDLPVRRASRARLAFAWPSERGEPSREATDVTIESGLLHPVRGRLLPESIWPSPDADETLCTARFTPSGLEGRERWNEAYERLHHPHTRRAGIWAASLWELYDKSGYFQLSGKTSAHFTHLRQAFTRAMRRLDTAPEIGCHVVWPTRDRVQAALSALLVYSGTAMIYQVARRRDEEAGATARQMLREVNLHAFEHLRRDPGFEWTLVYVQEGGARWSHLAYQTFTEAMLPTGLPCVIRFRAMESTRAITAPRNGYLVSAASAEERAQFFAALPKLRPQAYLEALDLVPERFDLKGVRERWDQAGFSRERELLVARENGRIVAAAVLESAQDALHLFGLLDCVRPFPFMADGERAYPALLQAARSWFRAQNKSNFVCFFEAESFAAAEQSGLTDLGAANLMAFPRLLVPDFLEHLWLVTAPRRRGH